MKKASDVFKSIRFAKGESRDKPHSSTDEEGHYTVGEKEYNQQLKHVKKMAMQEEMKDKYDEGEYDREGDMAKSDLRSIIANAQKLHDMVDDADNLPEWCQSKITLAEDYVSTVTNYMTSELDEATSAAVRMQRALQKAKEQREREQRAGEALLKPKQPVQKEEVEQIDEISDKTLVSYLTKVDADSRKHKSDPTKRDPKKASKSVMGFSKAFNKLDSRKPDGSIKEDVEQLDEMPGANMDTRALHSHLKKSGWKLSRTTGSHDVFTHEKAEDHIAVPRHRQLKAPLVKSILKQSKVNESTKGYSPGWMLKKDSKLGAAVKAAKDRAKHILGKPSDDYMKKTKSVAEEFDIEDAISFLKEGRPSQRHPLEGHEYHRKTDAELVHIAKDAHKAAEAMKGHNTTAENKYRDQANDSATVRYFRQKNGMPDWYKKKYGHIKEDIESDYCPECVQNPCICSGNHITEGRMKDKSTDYDFHPEIKSDSTPPFSGPYKNNKGTVIDKSGAKHSQMSRVKHIAKMAARRNAGINVKEEMDEFSTPAKQSLQATSGMTKQLDADKKKTDKKIKKDQFISNPELSSSNNKQ